MICFGIQKIIGNHYVRGTMTLRQLQKMVDLVVDKKVIVELTGRHIARQIVGDRFEVSDSTF